MMKISSLFFGSLLVISQAMGCGLNDEDGFVPKNNLYIPADQKQIGGLSEAQFNSVIEKLNSIYAPVVSNMGSRLRINSLWENGKVNAHASRPEVGFWDVTMFGGLARHSTMTPDGFALVLCHEIGHHIGGAPKKRSDAFKLWSSPEGQADYFATLKCLRKVFLNDDNQTITTLSSPPMDLKNACRKVWGSSQDYFICLRSGLAALTVANFFASLEESGRASLTTPDSRVVGALLEGHPDAQCRLDTLLQGALCDKSYNEDVSQIDEVKGTCHASLGSTLGLRPRCWFKSSL